MAFKDRQPSMETQGVDFDGKLDLDLLAKQRESLRKIIDDEPLVGSVEYTHLEGIDDLLAYIYDQLCPPSS